MYRNFINDLRSVSKKLKFYLFADDTNIYYETDTILLEDEGFPSNFRHSLNTGKNMACK